MPALCCVRMYAHIRGSLPSSQTPKCENQLGRLEKQIEKTISQMMQSTLNSLERDSEKVATAIDQMLDSDR